MLTVETALMFPIVLARSKTSTLQKELAEASTAGFDVLAMTCRRRLGGSELVATTGRAKTK